MKKNERVNKNKKTDKDQKRLRAQHSSELMVDRSPARETEQSLLMDAPFHSRMDEHAATLSRIPFAVQRQEYIMRLNNTYGLKYVQRLLESVNGQAKLTVSSPGDIYEQEADKVADEITREINTQAQRQNQEEEEEEEIQAQPQEEEEEEPVQMKRDEKSETVIANEIETRINSAKGSGQPLSGEVKNPMEQAFRADFSNVRIHIDSEADTLNKQLSAKAFTTGQDIFFRDGEYNPGSDSGKKLIAHELTHVVQQSSNSANRNSIKTQIQRWTWDGIKDQIPATTQDNLQGYKIVKMDTLEWKEQLWKIRWWRKSNLLIGTKDHTSKGYHSNKYGEVGLSRELDDNDAVATLVHEATHAGQYKQKAINPATFGSLIDREIEAHIEEEQYRIEKGMQSKTHGIAELADHQIERNEDGSINKKSVEDYVRWRYANRVPKGYRIIRQPPPERDNFQKREVIYTYIK